MIKTSFDSETHELLTTKNNFATIEFSLRVGAGVGRLGLHLRPMPVSETISITTEATVVSLEHLYAALGALLQEIDRVEGRKET